MKGINELNVVGQLSDYYGKSPSIRALLQLIPAWGVADTFLQQRADEIRRNRLRTFFNELSNGKIQLSEELIESEDFLHCYFSTLRAVLNSRRCEKIQMFAKLLNSSVTQPNFDSSEEFDVLLNVLDMITLKEFGVLSDLHKIERQHPTEADEHDVTNARRYWDNFRKTSSLKFSIPEYEFTPFMARLERTGLYLRITITVADYDGDMGRTTPLFSRLLKILEST